MKKRIFITAISAAFLLTACDPAAVEQVINSGIAGWQEAVNVQTGEGVLLPETSSEEESLLTDSVLSNDLIALTIPEELQGTTYASVRADRIDIYDKATVDAGFPGLVFSVGISSDCSVYAGGMYVKEGELFGADGTVYNVGKGTASEIQWDCNEPEMPESYKKLYDAADGIVENITGVGGNFFVYKSGTRGEELYFTVLDRYITAIGEEWDAEKLEDEEMSPELWVIASEAEDPFPVIGFAYADINYDGIDELLISDISENAPKGMVYDIYTMVDRVPAHVVSGTSRNRYYICGTFGLCNEYSGGAAESGSVFYILEPNSTELFWQVGYKYDAYEDEENPWFKSYSDQSWEPITEEEYNSAIEGAEEEKAELEYTPLSYISGIDFSKVNISKYASFSQITDSLYPKMAYTVITLNGTEVLLVASGCYDNGDGNQAAIDASVFINDEEGNVVFLGKLQSGGTANPLAVKDNSLYTAGHHFVSKYTVKDGKLLEEETAYEEYDSEGNVTYYYGSEDGGGYHKAEDDRLLNEMFGECFEAEILNFEEVSE